MHSDKKTRECTADVMSPRFCRAHARRAGVLAARQGLAAGGRAALEDVAPDGRVAHLSDGYVSVAPSNARARAIQRSHASRVRVADIAAPDRPVPSSPAVARWRGHVLVTDRHARDLEGVCGRPGRLDAAGVPAARDPPPPRSPSPAAQRRTIIAERADPTRHAPRRHVRHSPSAGDVAKTNFLEAFLKASLGDASRFPARRRGRVPRLEAPMITFTSATTGV